VTAVVVTGVGLHGALGDGAATWAALAGGRSALTTHPRPATVRAVISNSFDFGGQNATIVAAQPDPGRG
jgi:3-oxoacyl-(acyl-carrier-protein) synthase